MGSRRMLRAYRIRTSAGETFLRAARPVLTRRDRVRSRVPSLKFRLQRVLIRTVRFARYAIEDKRRKYLLRRTRIGFE